MNIEIENIEIEIDEMTTKLNKIYNDTEIQNDVEFQNKIAHLEKKINDKEKEFIEISRIQELKEAKEEICFQLDNPKTNLKKFIEKIYDMASFYSEANSIDTFKVLDEFLDYAFLMIRKIKKQEIKDEFKDRTDWDDPNDESDLEGSLDYLLAHHDIDDMPGFRD